MTSITAKASTIRRASLGTLAGRLINSVAAFLGALRAEWAELAISGQLGPDDEVTISRQTGGRI